MENIFTEADILLPNFKKENCNWTKWSVIACDQFTSELSYWNEVEKIAGDYSTLSLILPEAWLENSVKKDEHNKKIDRSMHNIPCTLKEYKNSMIYIERTFKNGIKHTGLIGKLDIDFYDYTPDSKSKIRPTEATVISRIPPREEIRSKATVELPHLMCLTNGEDGIFPWLEQNKNNFDIIYDFELMMDGGHITGYLINGDKLDVLKEKIAEYEAGVGDVVYSVGDGNHSLAAAKSTYIHNQTDLLKYALCEITSINDPAINFEPIYRLVINPSDDFINELNKVSRLGDGEQSFEVVINGNTQVRYFTNPSHFLVVGTLQNFIDEYIKNHSDTKCDYIHSKDSIIKLSNGKNIGFVFDGINKSELFSLVSKNGVLPRKTFSLGDAKEKRYYNESRKIQ